MSKRIPGTANLLLKGAREQRCWSQEDVAEKVETSAVNVSRWERGVTFPTPYFRQKLCVLFDKKADELGFFTESRQSPASAQTKADNLLEAHSADAPDLWSVPYSRNPFFTGRDDLLHYIHEVLNQQHALALTQSWAISGPGGIGKTQVALEYAYRYRKEYRCVFWVNAATQESLCADFKGIADILRLPERDGGDQNAVLLAVRKWFAAHQAWLLILDNADDISMLRGLVPPEDPGHLLFTSRTQALGPLAQRIDVEDMGLAEATLFLLRRAKLLAPGAFLDQVLPEQLAAAEALAITLAFFPLALYQAGAYIDEIGCSLSTYLE
ncbi:MAG: helix-turn-helix domain-containing protein, partial [Ktedonobacteraceae bacterium]